jgi:hypothetical protein
MKLKYIKIARLNKYLKKGIHNHLPKNHTYNYRYL